MAYTTLDETQTEIIENFGLLRAIKEGEDTATVDRKRCSKSWRGRLEGDYRLGWVLEGASCET